MPKAKASTRSTSTKSTPLTKVPKKHKPPTSAKYLQASLLDLEAEPLPAWITFIGAGTLQTPAYVQGTPNASEGAALGAFWELQAAQTLSIDLETYSLTDELDGALNPWSGAIRTIQVGLKSGRVIVIDLGGYGDDLAACKAAANAHGILDLLGVKLADPSVKVVGQNLAFDTLYLAVHFDWEVASPIDTMILSQCLWAGVLTYKHNLKALTERIRATGCELPLIDKELQRSNFGFPLTNAQIKYGALDAAIVLPLADWLLNACKSRGLDNTIAAEMAALPAYSKMMLNGIPVCTETLTDTIAAYETAYAGLVAPYAALFPEFGISASTTAKKGSDQGPSLFELLDDYDGDRYVPENEAAFLTALHDRLGARLQESLAMVDADRLVKADKDSLNPHRHIPEIASLLSARSCKTYLDYLYGVRAGLMVDAAGTAAPFRGGSIRGGYRQCAPQGRGRATSGASNSAPSVNLQNPPNPSKAGPEIAALGLPPIRGIFRAPDGYALGSNDYSAAHARIAAQTTQDPAFIAGYVANADNHCDVAAKIATLLGHSWTPAYVGEIRSQKTDEGRLATRCRNTAKNVFYGWLNGAGKAKTQETLRIGGFDCTIEFAGEIIDVLGAKFPRVAAFQNRLKHQIKEDKKRLPGCQMLYTPVAGISGRRVMLPVWPNGPDSYGGAKITDALMVCWMGVESDAKKAAMGMVLELGRQNPEWDLHLVNDAHDELVWVCKEWFYYQAHEAVDRVMAESLARYVTDIPVTDGPYEKPHEITRNWAQCK